MAGDALVKSFIVFVECSLHELHRRCCEPFNRCIDIARTPGIPKGHALTGDFGYVLKVAVRDLAGLQKLISDVLIASTVVDRARSEIVLETLRDDHIFNVTAE
jgi:DNA-binding Lrp family transcriptional regulator